MKILVADDDKDQRELYAELLSQNGYQVVEAVDGLDALEKSLQKPPDLVFTGIIMPRMDGFELIRNLRNNVATAVIPVIMFSHLGREEDKQKASKLLNVHFAVKGYDSPSEILEKVKDLLQHKPSNLELKPEDDERQPRAML
ncbi:MAG: response regulator [Candidatus Doudnabacteria bacterium]|nr:response regulator [Candidatus Doudnabacteria bacterium]